MSLNQARGIGDPALLKALQDAALGRGQIHSGSPIMTSPGSVSIKALTQINSDQLLVERYTVDSEPRNIRVQASLVVGEDLLPALVNILQKGELENAIKAWAAQMDFVRATKGV